MDEEESECENLIEKYTGSIFRHKANEFEHENLEYETKIRIAREM
jgi:hypothetical protein